MTSSSKKTNTNPTIGKRSFSTDGQLHNGRLFVQNKVMKISIIGSGNVATHMGKALKAAGHQILQVWSREFDHAELLADQLFAEPINQLSLLYPDADAYLLAVSDDALFDLAIDLQLRERLVLHTSGSVGISVLRPISRKHGVLYAPQSFVRTVAMDYSQLPFCIEGSSPEVYHQIEELARSISPNCFPINSEQRLWIHLASVMVNNFGNALNAMAQDILNKKCIPFDILQPLIQITADKTLNVIQQQTDSQPKSLWRLQTGPAVRHDEKTLDRHRSMLKDDNDALALYDLMTQLILDRTKPQQQ